MNIIQKIEAWFKKAKPDVRPNDVATQLGVHFEEVAEMIDALSAQTAHAQAAAANASQALTVLADICKGSEVSLYCQAKNRDELLDALCDQIVTAVGVGSLHSMNVVDALDEVSRSNNSKFDPETGDPICAENGKIMKGPAYRPPDLTPFV